MKTRNKWLGLASVVALIVMGASMSVSNQVHANDLDGIDFSGIETIVVEGADSHLDFTAVKGGKPSLHMTNDGWGQDFCNPTISHQRSGSTLHIRLSLSAFRSALPGQCDITLVVEMPENLNLSVLQPSTVTSIKGEVKDLSFKGDNAVLTIDGKTSDLIVDSEKVVITFSGSARSVSIKADQAVAELMLNGNVSPNAVAINANKLVANIGLPADTVLDCSVSAPLAVFSNAFKSTPGAATKIEIRSMMLKGSLYEVSRANQD